MFAVYLGRGMKSKKGDEFNMNFKEKAEQIGGGKISNWAWWNAMRGIVYNTMMFDIADATQKYIATGDDNSYTEKQMEYMLEYYEPLFKGLASKNNG